MATGPSCDFGGTALLAVVRVNGLWNNLTANSLSDPSWSVVDCVTYDGAVEHNILAAFGGTTPLEGLRASTSGWIQGADENEL